VAVVEVVVDVETIRISTMIIGMSMISVVVMAMAAMIVRTIEVALADMVVAVAMAADTLREIVRIMTAVPMKLVRYVARLGILH
jgi:hypothetical protein